MTTNSFALKVLNNELKRLIIELQSRRESEYVNHNQIMIELEAQINDVEKAIQLLN